MMWNDIKRRSNQNHQFITCKSAGTGAVSELALKNTGMILRLLAHSRSFPKVTTTAPLGKEFTVTPKLGYFTHIGAGFTFKC